MISLYVNETLDPAEAFVISELTPQPIEVPELVLTNKPTINLYVVDGIGNFSDVSGAGGYSVEFLIGRIGEAAVVAQNSWGTITNGWSATVDLNTLELIDLFGDEESIEAFVQVTLTDGSAMPRTYAQERVRLVNRVLPAGPGTPTPVDDYLTSVETFNQFVQNRSAITGLTGGGALNLDGILTADASAGWMVAIFVSSALYHYQLVNGTDAESSPNVIRPGDYNTVTNAKVWKLRQGPTIATAGNPNTLGLTGAYHWQQRYDTTDSVLYAWNAPTSEWWMT